ncbi:uncharacterized protein PAC_07751 [Phialocephala subalpina]|uniref:Heterokaryon incompatibility domain-containing protein n=1 Tax=Phialocephala subalpina TaxID=576137 RepID=A0A1L7WYL1_9HELO|nr:uncharacterized protein PAC_07751 [Phialocephala subalpina]
MPHDIPYERFITHPQRIQLSCPRVGEPRAAILPVIRPPKQSSTLQWKYYNYERLPTPTSIRILRLELPIMFQEADIYKPPIHGSLEVRDLSDSPEYLALSYTWGDPLTIYENHSQVSSTEDWSAPAFELILDGQPVSIATNLYTALLSLRCHGVQSDSILLPQGLTLTPDTIDNRKQPRLKACFLWIDALCINQQDLAERGEQIKLMSKIYSQAYAVCAWLGGEDLYSQSALEVVRRLSGDVNEKNFPSSRWQKFRAYDIRDPRPYKEISMPYTAVDDWLKLYAFINRSWFKRTWIVQEAYLSQRIFVLCGLCYVSFPAVFNAVNFASGFSRSIRLKLLAEKRMYGHIEVGFREFQNEEAGHLSFYRPRPLSTYNQNIVVEVMSTHGMLTGKLGQPEFKLLGTLLDRYRGTLAGDPRDKVYAFLGIAKEFQGNSRSLNQQLLVPDYTKSVTDVYTDTMKFLVRSSGNLLFLGLKESRNDSPLSDLPSWVPDFNASFPNMLSYPGDEPWTAFGSVKSSHFDFVGKRSLKVTGHRVCRVVEMAAEPFHAGNIRDTIPILSRLPEQSEVRNPNFNISILQFHNAPRNVSERKQVNARLRELRDTYIGTLQHQSRYEVLWRTLLVNKWDQWQFGGLPRSYPAPHEIEDFFGSHIVNSIYQQQLLVAIAYLHQLKFPVADLLPEAEGGENSNIPWPLVENYDPERYETPAAWISTEGSKLSTIDWTNELAKLGEMIGAWNKLQGGMPWVDNGAVIPPEVARFLYDMQEENSSDALRQEVAKDFLLKISYNTLPRRSSQSSHSRYLLKKQVIEAIKVNSQVRRLFATDSARLGLGPRTMEEGDEVWIVESGAMPLILRPAGSEGEYLLVGEAYVHGIMHGEAVSEDMIREICLI